MIGFAKLYAAYPVKGSPQADATEAQAAYQQLLTEFPNLEEQMDASIEQVKQKRRQVRRATLASALDKQRASRSSEHANSG